MDILKSLEPQIERAYEEHMQISSRTVREGVKHEVRQPLYPPYVLADAAGLKQDETDDPLIYGPILRERFNDYVEQFESGGVDIRPTLAASFLVNLLTEDNLPYYTERNLSMASNNEAMETWVKEWVAEEDSHGTLMRDYALLTGIIGPKDNKIISHAAYHQGRTKQLRVGTEIDPSTTLEAFHYLTLQELLTVKAHKMLSFMLDQSGVKVIKPMVGDEQNHYTFYRKASDATFEREDLIDDSLVAMNNIYSNFEMPGRAGIPRYRSLASIIAISGIFDLETITEAKKTIVSKLGVERLEPRTDQGKLAQEELLSQTNDEAMKASRDLMETIRDQHLEKSVNKQLRPFVLGRTVDFEYSQSIPPRKTKLLVL